MWQRPLLLTVGVLELIMIVPSTIFGLLLGYHGFVAGEMGTMVGILALAVLVPLVPYSVARLAALVGLWRRRRWGAVLTIILSVLAAAGGVVVAFDAPAVLAVMITYAAVTAWAAVGCLKHPSFGGPRP